MPKISICGGKYQMSTPKEPGAKPDTIGLPVSLSNLPKTLEIEGEILSLKNEFHVTLVAIGKIIEKFKVSDPDFIDKVVNDFCDFNKTNPIDFIKYKNEFRFAVRVERRTVVAMCEVSNLEKFYEYFNKKYGLNVEYPPLHITLYTLQPDTGIFLLNSEDIKKLTKIIPSPVTLD